MTTPKAPASVPPVCGNKHDDPRIEEVAKAMAEYLHGEPWADMPEDTRGAFREHAAFTLSALQGTGLQIVRNATAEAAA
ncbi:hypothetical protein Srufu_080290 (plasmid) [Streptomyces libani subsp. rufus]|nr:hypothetical protein Srufu_080290 [Streptomyces libani subsp. rufus]